jgi:ABC-type lipoprotein export system ATPase subunit
MTDSIHVPILRLNSVTLRYHRGEQAVDALRDVTVVLHPGEFVGLVGPSGSGKSSLLNILGFVRSPDAGTLEVEGRQVQLTHERELRTYRRSMIGFVFQRFHLLPTLTAVENVMVTLRLNSTPQREARRRALSLLESVGLSARADHLPRQLSGGEMQRVAVCRALAHRPKVLLADEPTGNLDTESGARVLNLLSQAARDGTTVLMATHSAEAQSYCSRVIRLRDGRVVE